jgi:hypothetical protein
MKTNHDNFIPPQRGAELPLKRFVGGKNTPNKSLERKSA